MKRLLRKIVFENDTRTSGLIALLVISLIAFGCTCGKNFDFSKLGEDGDSSSSNSQPDFAKIGSNSDNTASNSDDDSSFPGSTSDDKDGKTVPNDSDMEALVRETTSDFALAITIEDFTLIHGKASSDFQGSYTADEMKNAFSSFISQKSRVLPSLTNTVAVKPRFSPSPGFRYENGTAILTAKGEFPSKPLTVKFEYEYVFRDGEWKMLKLVIRM